MDGSEVHPGNPPLPPPSPIERLHWVNSNVAVSIRTLYKLLTNLYNYLSDWLVEGAANIKQVDKIQKQSKKPLVFLGILSHRGFILTCFIKLICCLICNWNIFGSDVMNFKRLHREKHFEIWKNPRVNWIL